MKEWLVRLGIPCCLKFPMCFAVYILFRHTFEYPNVYPNVIKKDQNYLQENNVSVSFSEFLPLMRKSESNQLNHGVNCT